MTMTRIARRRKIRAYEADFDAAQAALSRIKSRDSTLPDAVLVDRTDTIQNIRAALEKEQEEREQALEDGPFTVASSRGA